MYYMVFKNQKFLKICWTVLLLEGSEKFIEILQKQLRKIKNS